ncbi:unnamed protein product [Moneuplotes crassus]|uniref:BZIP domain-containing protein n=1 Tax=Euplotes crassus TaxID=5936 RepID=A0AAD1UGW3_EUPCR|nr:unnamed protein product [Moneuplotes crassus]
MSVTKISVSSASSQQIVQNDAGVGQISQNSKDHSFDDPLSRVLTSKGKNRERKSGKQRAREFRQRKKQYYQNLEKQNAELQQKIKTLTQNQNEMMILLKNNNIEIPQNDDLAKGQQFRPDPTKINELGITQSKDDVGKTSLAQNSAFEHTKQLGKRSPIVPTPAPPAYNRSTMSSFMIVSRLVSLLGENSFIQKRDFKSTNEQDQLSSHANPQNPIDVNSENSKLGSLEEPILVDEIKESSSNPEEIVT